MAAVVRRHRPTGCYEVVVDGRVIQAHNQLDRANRHADRINNPTDAPAPARSVFA